MYEWISKLMGGLGGQSSGSMPEFSEQTGTPDGVGPVQGGINTGPIGDYTDEELKAMLADKNKPKDMSQGYAQMGMMSGPGGSANMGQYANIPSLMSMATSGMQQRQQRPLPQGPSMNPYVRGLMGR